MSHVPDDESCHVWMSHVSYTWVTSHVKESFVISLMMSHVTYVPYTWIMSRKFHVRESCLILNSYFGYAWVILIIDESYKNESCHSPFKLTVIWIRMSHFNYEWVIRERVMSQSCQVNESFCIWMSHFTYEWVMQERVMSQSSHMRITETRIRMSHVTYEWVILHVDESCHGWVMSPWTNHAAYQWVVSCMDETRHTWTSHVTWEQLSRIRMSHGTRNASCSETTHSYVESFHKYNFQFIFRVPQHI